MVSENLETAIRRVGNPVDFLRNSQYPAFEFPVRPEFSNWRSEQMAWRETVVLLDQSHHMSNLFISGPDALKGLSDHAVNSFANFGPGRAKQYVAANSDGYFIGDGILFHMEDGSFDLVSNPSIINWVQYHLEKGGYDVEIRRDDNSNRRKGPPKLYRYELQGPNAKPLMEAIIGGPVPEVKFFHMANMTIGGRPVAALRHGMAGQPGFEIFGPWEDGEAVLEAILAKGDEFGLKRGGARAYSTANLESGWIPRPMSAIFGPKEKAFREWLPATAVGSLGGSMDSPDIADYYLTPHDIGYDKVVKFDHDFVGREAIEKEAVKPRRTKVTLHWNVDDVTAIMRSQFEPGLPAKFIEMPKSRYAFYHVDKVMKGGRMVGMSTDVGYITNERAFISLASVDLDLAKPGSEVTVLWGENPNTRKPAVEPHRQVEVRATVAPVPFAQVIRDGYRVS
ncbi:MAG TPA: aminomethyl transferase family protein [Rhizobiaceae bacterium]|nr:aminomethyl transferase family protein [Rhizobiaceae bacterium]